MTTEKVIEEATRLGIINPTKLRNMRIRNEYKILKDAGRKYEESVEELSKKYYISESSIKSILTKK